MIAVGIDVSKSKSTVAILNSDGSQRINPYDMKHNHPEMNALVNYLNELDEPIIILMEYTGHYHYPVLKKLTDEHFQVCLVNPYQMKKYGDTELRRSKTDKKDAVRIATYALEKSYQLVPYSVDDQKYIDLKLLSRQYSQRMSTLTINKVYLVNMLDQTMPGVTSILPLRSRDPDTSLSMMFIKKYKSFDYICKMGKTRFLDSYSRLVKKARNRNASHLGLAIYELATQSITTNGENEYTVLAQTQCIDLVAEAQRSADCIIAQMQTIAETLPEYKILRNMPGVGERLGPLILAEIGNVRRFHSGKALNAYAGNDAPPYQSGKFTGTDRHISKRGSSTLRKVGFETMTCLVMQKKCGDPVYDFIKKKQAEGKACKVAKIAGFNKFLRIYYARVMEVYQ